MRSLCTKRSWSFLAVLAGFLAVPANQARAQDPLTVAAVSLVGGYLFGKLADEFVDPYVLGKPDTRQMKAELETLAARDRQHAAALSELSRRLDNCATREDVRRALTDTLTKVDTKLASQAERIEKLERAKDDIYRQLGVTRADLRRFQIDITNTVRRQGIQLDSLQREMDEFKRWKPDEVSAQLGVAGFDYFHARDYRSGIRSFRYSHAYDTSDPGPLYALALCHVRLGEEDKAEQMVAYAIAAERVKGPSSWYLTCLERVQGPTRHWLASRRSDPVLGIRSVGNMPIIRVNLPGEEPIVPLVLPPKPE